MQRGSGRKVRGEKEIDTEKKNDGLHDFYLKSHSPQFEFFDIACVLLK